MDDSDHDAIMFQFWDGIYYDLEKSIFVFVSVSDMAKLCMTSKKFYQMIINADNNMEKYHQSFDGISILPSIKDFLVVQRFNIKNEKENESKSDIAALLMNDKEKQQERQENIDIYKNIDFIKLLQSKNICISKWFLQYLIKNQGYLTYNLVSCEQVNKRQQFAELIIASLNTLKSI